MARVLVFVSTAAVLMLEILAGRLLAPYVGISVETFTGIIGTVLAAIALGSWIGGRVADQRDPAPLIGPLFAVGGVLALLAPTITTLFGVPLQGQGAPAVVVITLLAFFAPAAVLSAVSPLVVKMRLQSLDETGEVVGSLSAVGTIGALFGTFVTGFVLIATVPTRPIVFAIGVLLIVIGVGFGVGDRVRAIGGGGLAALALILVPGPCEWETSYSCANVVVDTDNPSGRTLQLDLLSHSYIDIDDPENLKFRYTRDMAAAIDAVAPAGLINTLGIGGGGFTMPRYFAATRPGSTNTVFEIDGTLVDIATDELGLDLDAVALTVETTDARIAMTRHLDGGADVDPFDVVVGDAFGGVSVPWHLTTVEFAAMIKESMAPDGVYVMNVIDYPPYRFARAEVATLERLFDNVALITIDRYLNGGRGGNIVLVATDAPIDPDAIGAEIVRWGSPSSVFMGSGLEQFVDEADVLTDDFAPVDQMIDVPAGG